jgi:hypothetical protein
MPYTFVIDKSRCLVRETWTGNVTFADLQKSSQEEWSHPDYRPGFSVISDFRAAESDMTADEVLRFASWFSGEDTPRRHAIVISKQNGIDLAGMFSIIRDSVGESERETQLFFSLVAAEAWVERA